MSNPIEAFGGSSADQPVTTSQPAEVCPPGTFAVPGHEGAGGVICNPKHTG